MLLRKRAGSRAHGRNTGEMRVDSLRAALPSEADVVSSWQGDRPVVSILCPTYQHSGFIDDALSGFLSQRTTFPFEVLVRDDGSTDGTAEIVADYAQRYPLIVRAVLETSNTWPAVKPSMVLTPMARGEFATTCEGDDYWSDPVKLEKQVEMLRRHPEAVACFHDVISVDSEGAWGAGLTPRQRADRSVHMWSRDPSLPGQSLVYRNVVGVAPELSPRIVNGDTFLQVRLSRHGSALFDPTIRPSVYRIHAGGIWSMHDPVKRAIEQASSFYWISHYLADSGDRELAEYYLTLSAVSVAQSHLAQGIDPRPSIAHRMGWPGRTLGPILSRRSPRILSAIRRATNG